MSPQRFGVEVPRQGAGLGVLAGGGLISSGEMLVKPEHSEEGLLSVPKARCWERGTASGRRGLHIPVKAHPQQVCNENHVRQL